MVFEGTTGVYEHSCRGVTTEYTPGHFEATPL